jgi:excisionase family DNA binding protein
MPNHVRADGRVRGAAADNIITAPIARFCELAGIGRSKTYELIAAGEIESVVLGGRRLVVIDSWRRLVEAAPRDRGPRRQTSSAAQ